MRVLLQGRDAIAYAMKHGLTLTCTDTTGEVRDGVSIDEAVGLLTSGAAISLHARDGRTAQEILDEILGVDVLCSCTHGSMGGPCSLCGHSHAMGISLTCAEYRAVYERTAPADAPALPKLEAAAKVHRLPKNWLDLTLRQCEELAKLRGAFAALQETSKTIETVLDGTHQGTSALYGEVLRLSRENREMRAAGDALVVELMTAYALLGADSSDVIRRWREIAGNIEKADA